MRSAIVAAAVVMSLPGCGDERDDEADTPARTVQAYLAALAEGDGDRACDELTADGRAELAALVPLHLRVAPMKDCVATAEQLSDAMYPALADELIDAQVDEVRVDGARATASARGGPARMRLVRRDGDWRIDESLKGGWREMGVPEG